MITSITIGHPSQVILDSWSEAKGEENKVEPGEYVDPLAPTTSCQVASDTACNAIIPQPIRKSKHMKAFKCSHCSFIAWSRSLIITHMRVHTGEKPFQCDVCVKRFTRMYDLKRHKWLHTGEHPFRCPFCPKKFTHRSRIDPHIKRHHSLQWIATQS